METQAATPAQLPEAVLVAPGVVVVGLVLVDMGLVVVGVEIVTGLEVVGEPPP